MTSEGELLNTFKELDTNGDGYIDELEFKTFFFGLGMNEADVDATFKAADSKLEGKIDYKHFVQWMVEAPDNVRTHMVMDTSSVDAMFEEMAKQFASKMKSDYNAKLKADKAHLQMRYEKEIRRAEDHYKTELSQFIDQCQSIHPARQAGGDESPETSDNASTLDGAVEAGQLKKSLSELLGASRPSLDKNLLPYHAPTATILQQIIDTSKSLQQYAERCMQSMTVVFTPTDMTGTKYPVEVYPHVDTVKTVKNKIHNAHGIPSYKIRLILVSGIELRDRENLGMYDLSAAITLIVGGSIVGSPLLHLRFDDPENPAFDDVSETSGTIANPEQMNPVNEGGRAGMEFTMFCTLTLPKPIRLESNWTIGVWIHTPLSNAGRFNDILCGDGRWFNPILLMGNGVLGYYCDARGYQSTALNVTTLSNGWHHIAVVCCQEKGNMRYFVDGEEIGQIDGCIEGTVGAVGNRHDAAIYESAGYLSDMRIFGEAADEAQVKELAA